MGEPMANEPAELARAVGNSVDSHAETVFTTYMTETRTDISHRSIPSVRQARRNPQMVTIARAVEAVARTGEARYVFATYGAWNIGTEAPASGSYYEFATDGRWMVER